MQVKIIKIGNSKGIVIPSDILKVFDIKEKDKVNLIIDKNKIILEAAKDG